MLFSIKTPPVFKYFFSSNYRAQELIAHGKNQLNLGNDPKSRVIDQAIITSNIIKERIRRNKMAEMERIHREESIGGRNEQIEQEQNQQEHDSSLSDDPDDPLLHLPQSVAEPAIELTVEDVSETLRDIEGDDEISISILSNQLDEIDGTNDQYPSDSEQQEPHDSFDFLQTGDF